MRRSATAIAMTLALAACGSNAKPWTAPPGTPKDGQKVPNEWANSQTYVTLACKDGSKLHYLDAGSWRSTDRIFHAAANPPYEPDFEDAIIGPCKGYTTTTTAPSTTPVNKKQRAVLVAVVRRDVKAATVALRCASCDPYKSYLWLVKHRRGYTPLTKKEIVHETKRVCALSAQGRDSTRTNIALLRVDARSNKKRLCP